MKIDLDLTPDQQRAFNRLKRAVKDCKKLNVFFHSVLGELSAYNGEFVDAAFNESTARSDCQDMKESVAYSDHIEYKNTVHIVAGFADDDNDQRFHLTEKGLEILNK